MMMIRILHVCGVLKRNANTHTHTRKKKESASCNGIKQLRIACRQNERMNGTDGTCLTKSAKNNNNNINTKTACAELISLALSLLLSIASIHHKYCSKFDGRFLISNHSNCFEKTDSIRFYIHYTLSFQTAFIAAAAASTTAAAAAANLKKKMSDDA